MIRVLVAKQDGVIDRSGDAFEPGSIRPCGPVPVVNKVWDNPVGFAMITVDGTDVYAEINVSDERALNGWYPALGFVPVQTCVGPVHVDDSGVCRFSRVDVLVVHVSAAENVDVRIPPIVVPGREIR